jgi:hypothetical protein
LLKNVYISETFNVFYDTSQKGWQNGGTFKSNTARKENPVLPLFVTMPVLTRQMIQQAIDNKDDNVISHPRSTVFSPLKVISEG